MKSPFAIYTVQGHSMLPTLRPGQRLLVYRWGKPKVGDLIVFKKEAKTMVKRVVGMEGERRIVQGDNPEESSDSREWGGVKPEEIIGKILSAVL